MYYLLLSWIGFVLFTNAATSPTPLYQEVVATAGQSVDQLRSHTQHYLHALDQEKRKKQRQQWQANADSTTFTFDTHFLLYNRKTVRHPLGEITYRTTIDLKAGKYRYTADSVFFQAYRRDRYSRYVPSRQPAVAWSEALPDFSAKERQRVLVFLRTQFQAFKECMQAQSQPQAPSPTANNW